MTYRSRADAESLNQTCAVIRAEWEHYERVRSSGARRLFYAVLAMFLLTHGLALWLFLFGGQ